MPLKHLGRLGVHIHLNVGVAHVNPNHLRVCASDCFNRNTVVLLLIDNLDAVRDARRRVDEVCGVIQKYRTVANKITGRAECTAKDVRRPAKNLVLCRKDSQSFCVPRINHLIERGKSVLRRCRRRRFRLCELTNKPQSAVNLISCGSRHGGSLCLVWLTTTTYF